MSKPEHIIQSEIQLAASNAGVPLFRNNTGAYTSESGSYIRFGVGGPGGSDLIGITPVTITPDMVGDTIGVFTAIEVKTKNGRPTKQQTKFIESVKRNGGIAGIARSADDALSLIKK